MKHMLLVMTLVASSADAQEFASDAPAVGAILAKTRALQAAAPASLASAKLLHDIETTMGLLQKYGDDPTRAGIYKAELSLLHLKLALGDVHGVGASTPLPNTTMTEAERSEKQARLRSEIVNMKDKLKTYENDPLRAGIYAADLGLLQARLALETARKVR